MNILILLLGTIRAQVSVNVTQYFSSVIGYPSSPYYSLYHYDSNYLYYLLGQLKNSGDFLDCVRFNPTDPFKRIFRLSPQTVIDTFNFLGDAEIETSKLSIVLGGSGLLLDSHLTDINGLNSSLKTVSTLNQSEVSNINVDIRTNLLLNKIMSTSSYNIKFDLLTLEENSIMNGNLYSHRNHSILTGSFSLRNLFLSIRRAIQVNPTFDMAFNDIPMNTNTNLTVNLQGVTNVYLDNTTLTILLLAGSVSKFKNLNLTTASSPLVSGTVIFNGTSVYVDDCKTNIVVPPTRPTNPDQRNFVGDIQSILYLIAFVIFLIVYIYYVYVRKPTILRPRSSDDSINRVPRRRRVLEFYETYPPGELETLEVAKQTAILPHSMSNSQSKVSFLLPRMVPRFEFEEPLPEIIIDAMDSEKGTQRIEFSISGTCTIQTNASLIPRELDPPEAGSDILLPPPSFSHAMDHEECYFQVKFLRIFDSQSRISIGFASVLHPPFSLPGSDAHSIAYHSDNGFVSTGNIRHGRSCGPALVEDDILGVGYRVEHQGTNPRLYFYFTLNSQRFETEFSPALHEPSLLRPTIGATADCHLQVIFGDIERAFVVEF
ncbi:Rsp5p-dependent ubiquitination, sorting of cargo proteins at the multivesicular body [Globomyces sp. JEL0801]|nr:Rsp5p-dependent ubiquitination, sorting of cargo proteins at the multivesicular body [Globomyces sp. JEL0801]